MVCLPAKARRATSRKGATVPKVAMIGAGSTVCARRLMIDSLSWPELAETAIALMDIDPARLGLVEALARRLVAPQRLPACIEATADRRAALDGAGYIVCLYTARVSDDGRARGGAAAARGPAAGDRRRALCE
jgi:alpha-galactosidase/6-phospho-beta-glucosidase family protein